MSEGIAGIVSLISVGRECRHAECKWPARRVCEHTINNWASRVSKFAAWHSGSARAHIEELMSCLPKLANSICAALA